MKTKTKLDDSSRAFIFLLLLAFGCFYVSYKVNFDFRDELMGDLLISAPSDINYFKSNEDLLPLSKKESENVSELFFNYNFKSKIKTVIKGPYLHTRYIHNEDYLISIYFDVTTDEYKICKLQIENAEPIILETMYISNNKLSNPFYDPLKNQLFFLEEENEKTNLFYIDFNGNKELLVENAGFYNVYKDEIFVNVNDNIQLYNLETKDRILLKRKSHIYGSSIDGKYLGYTSNNNKNAVIVEDLSTNTTEEKYIEDATIINITPSLGGRFVFVAFRKNNSDTKTRLTIYNIQSMHNFKKYTFFREYKYNFIPEYASWKHNFLE